MDKQEDGVKFQIEIALGESAASFNMEKAVCNHGFFMMSPNVWIPSTKSLRRPLQLADDSRSLPVTISHPSPNHPFLIIHVHGVPSLPSADQAAILGQVARMLRLSNKDDRDVRNFQTLHPSAKEKGFGRIFRSPSLFEDAVKSILLCNCGWKRTLSMAQALCQLQPQLAKANSKSNYSKPKGRRPLDQPIGNFPTPKEVACLDEKCLSECCNLGYRAKLILLLARKIETGKLDHLLNELEESSDETSYDKLYGGLMKIKGFGPFVCSNIMMCVGFYERIPSDTETIRHVKMVHGKEKCSQKTIKKDVEEIYSKYAPYQCIAYWMELVDEYEKIVGKLSELDPSSYHLVTGNGNNKAEL